MATSYKKIFQSLLHAYGTQSWWPANSRFEVMVGAILTQNTAWSNVEKAIDKLNQHNVLSLDAIINLKHEQLAELIRSSGYFNIKAKRLQALCHWYELQPDVDSMDTDQLRSSLLKVHGVGPETADDILLYAFERPVFVIDTYTRRLFARTACADGDAEYDFLRQSVEQAMGYSVADLNEFHALIVVHAKRHCKKTPECHNCPLIRQCDYCMKNKSS